jgi:hypothetical protein
LTSAAVGGGIAIDIDLTLMLAVVVIEEGAHLRDAGFVYDEFLIDAVDLVVHLTYDGDHWLDVEVPGPYTRAVLADLWLGANVESFVEANIGTGAAHAWEPLTIHANAATSRAYRVDALEAGQLTPVNSWVVIDGGAKDASVEEGASPPRLNDLREDPGRLRLLALWGEDGGGAEEGEGAGPNTYDTLFVYLEGMLFIKVYPVLLSSLIL